jgi:hypothetical protein
MTWLNWGWWLKNLHPWILNIWEYNSFIHGRPRKPSKLKLGMIYKVIEYF